ncbi:hypothetical protein LWI29_028474 [Acer saccharum]|uniref:Uncharacterized protein n=1 Tax=Acer saccharum TaxID=4024 RepID=A0AA39SRI3_ACESA|nr:hypothetical protein LWI29_028474 [Acer saccharum]
MPRVKIVDLDEASGSTNPRVLARERVSRRTALNPNFEERMEIFGEKECHPERGIEVSELGGDSRRPGHILRFPCLITEFYREAEVDMSETGDAAAFNLPQGIMNANTWKGIHKSKKRPETTGESSKPTRKKKRTVVEDDDDHWYSEAALHDDVYAVVGFEEDIPRDDFGQNSVERILDVVKVSQVANQAAIQEVGRGLHMRIDWMNEDWGFDMTELRRELVLSVYSRRRRRGPTASTLSVAPVGGPVIDEGGAMELSRKEAKDRAAVEKDPRGKRVV